MSHGTAGREVSHDQPRAFASEHGGRSTTLARRPLLAITLVFVSVGLLSTGALPIEFFAPAAGASGVPGTSSALSVSGTTGGLASSPGAGGAPVETVGTAEPETDSPPLTGGFAGEGDPLGIGTGSATIDAVVHVSVLTDPAAGDEFGVELAGSLDRDPIVTLAAGVRFDAPELITTGNPFAAFDLLYTYELRLPMFDGVVEDPELREDSPPVGSPAGAVSC